MTSVPQQPQPAPASATAQPADPPGVTADPPGAATTPTGAPAAPSGATQRRTGVRTLAAALPAGAIGASLVLVAAGKTWSRGTAAFGSTQLPVHATGTDTTALPGALALVALASLVAVFAVRRTGRYVVAALLTLSGLGVVVLALARRGDHAALDSAAATAAGLAHTSAAHAETTSWPLVSAAGGLLLLAAGLLALRYGQSWPAMSSRYDRPGGRGPVRARAAASAAGRPAPVDPDRAEDLWKALDRGEDPTG